MAPRHLETHHLYAVASRRLKGVNMEKADHPKGAQRASRQESSCAGSWGVNCRQNCGEGECQKARGEGERSFLPFPGNVKTPAAVYMERLLLLLLLLLQQQHRVPASADCCSSTTNSLWSPHSGTPSKWVPGADAPFTHPKLHYWSLVPEGW